MASEMRKPPSLSDGLRLFIYLPNETEPGMTSDIVPVNPQPAKQPETTFEEEPFEAVSTTLPLDDVDHPDFDGSSRWPRRLLNVKTMVSCKWQPENSYGGIVEPTYSIVSYTWGRWRIRNPKSTVPALPVKGVPWDIPRVDPAHFTADEFMKVVQAIGDGPGKSGFVWVDIACIPQMKFSAVAASEICRQVRIFRGASDAFVWLTTVSTAELDSLHEGHRQVRFFHNQSRIVDNFKVWCKVLEDPWLSSLWTLQESYIQRESKIVTNDGRCKLDLYDLQLLAEDFDLSKKLRTELENDLTIYKARWLRSGLYESTPMQVLACSRYRTCEYELDRVYGIMQIFGTECCIGKARLAAEGKDVGARFTLQQLQDELGALLMQKVPATSQLFRHDEPPLAGRAWRVCGKISCPAPLGTELQSFDDSHATDVALFAKSDGTTTWATFCGKTCQLSRLVKCSTSLNIRDLQRDCRIYIDAGLSFEDFKERNLTELFQHFGPRADQDLSVLLLSSKVVKHPKVTRLETGFLLQGLLLLAPGDEKLNYHKSRRDWHSVSNVTATKAWARVGVCYIKWVKSDWSAESKQDRPEIQTLLGKTSDWIITEGIWG